jgi:hypothetical protein
MEAAVSLFFKCTNMFTFSCGTGAKMKLQVPWIGRGARLLLYTSSSRHVAFRRHSPAFLNWSTHNFLHPPNQSTEQKEKNIWHLPFLNIHGRKVILLRAGLFYDSFWAVNNMKHFTKLKKKLFMKNVLPFFFHFFKQEINLYFWVFSMHSVHSRTM